MTIKFIQENVNRPLLNYSLIKKVINTIITDSNFVKPDITYIFCSDSFLLDLNVRFLSHDYFTDIITFNYNNGNSVSGDIFISVERVFENAGLFNCTFEEEILRVIFHGVLHLVGFDDHEEHEKIRMREMEDKYLDIYRFLE